MHGKTILITREKEAAIASARVYLDLGARVKVCPLIQVMPVEFQTPTVDIEQDTLLITSQNATKILISRVSQFSKCKCIVVGQKSSDILSNNGFNVLNAFEDSKQLLRYLLENKPTSLVYFRGEDIASDLDEKLQDMGIKLRQVICYKTIPANVTDAFLDSVDIVTLYSPKTAEIFARFLPHALSRDLIVAALSENIARKLDGLTFQELLIAKRPTEKDLLKAIAKAV